MKQQNVLVVDPAGGVARSLLERGFDAWSIHHANDVPAAQALLRNIECHAGIMVLSAGTDPASREFAQCLDESRFEWIALVEPDALRHRELGAFVVSHFYDFHTLPIDDTRLRVVLGHACGKADLQQRFESAPDAAGRFGMTGDSPAIQAIYRQLEKVVHAEVPVLLSGESGTGKELVARAIHRYSARATGPFVAMNCAAIPTDLIQSELFGHEKGAFTGAHQRKIGNIEASHKGVLFLDEIGDLSPRLQTNLLRCLQEMTITRLGGSDPVRVDTRVVAATNVDLTAAIARGEFRADLFYRLNVVHLHLPPLRERLEDVRALALHTFRHKGEKKNPQLIGFREDALRAMEQHNWPGNVRELVNRVRRAMIMGEGRLITPADLGLALDTSAAPVTTLERARSESDRATILRCLANTDGNVTLAAQQLGISRGKLYRLMGRLGISPRGDGCEDG